MFENYGHAKTRPIEYTKERVDLDSNDKKNTVQIIRTLLNVIEIVNKMPFPLAKLISLGLKQASKYVASFVKHKAKEHETMRKIIIKSAECEYLLSTRLISVFAWYQYS